MNNKLIWDEERDGIFKFARTRRGDIWGGFFEDLGTPGLVVGFTGRKNNPCRLIKPLPETKMIAEINRRYLDMLKSRKYQRKRIQREKSVLQSV